MDPLSGWLGDHHLPAVNSVTSPSKWAFLPISKPQSLPIKAWLKILQKLHFYIHCLIKKSSYDFKKYLLVTELFVNCLQKFYVLNFVNMTLKP